MEKLNPAPLEQLDTRSLDELLDPERFGEELTERVSLYLLIRAQALKTMANAQAESSQKHGITETVDLLEAAEATALKILEEVQDGIDPVDAVQVVLDGDVRDAWAQAAEGAAQVDEEVLDLSSEEAFDLVRKSTDVGESIFVEVTS